jgi:hypothetical protein
MHLKKFPQVSVFIGDNARPAPLHPHRHFPAGAEKVMEICVKSGIVIPDIVIDQVSNVEET